MRHERKSPASQKVLTSFLIHCAADFSISYAIISRVHTHVSEYLVTRASKPFWHLTFSFRKYKRNIKFDILLLHVTFYSCKKAHLEKHVTHGNNQFPGDMSFETLTLTHGPEGSTSKGLQLLQQFCAMQFAITWK